MRTDWNRARFKETGKATFLANYWPFVGVLALLLLLSGNAVVYQLNQIDRPGVRQGQEDQGAQRRAGLRHRPRVRQERPDGRKLRPLGPGHPLPGAPGHHR